MIKGPEEFIESIEKLCSIHNYTEADKVLQEALDLDPKNLKLVSFATRTYREIGMRKKSLDLSRKTFLLFPEHPIVHINYAQDLLAMSRFMEASDYINKARRVFPRNAKISSLHKLINQIELFQNRFQDSCQDLKQKSKDWNAYNKQQIPGGLYATTHHHLTRHAFLIRCIEIGEAEERLAEQLASVCRPADVFFCIDRPVSSSDKKNVISVADFRKDFGLDWPILNRIGWKFGDFCFYSAVHYGLDHDYFVIVESDICFLGASLESLVNSFHDNSSDLLAANYGTRGREWTWSGHLLRQHPSISEVFGCLFPLVRLSRSAAVFLFLRRLQEFNYFLTDLTAQIDSINKFFPNDEAFTCSLLSASRMFSANGLDVSLTRNSFSFNSTLVLHPCSFRADTIVHSHYYSIATFHAKIHNLLRARVSREDFFQTAISCIDLNTYNVKALKQIRKCIAEELKAEDIITNFLIILVDDILKADFVQLAIERLPFLGDPTTCTISLVDKCLIPPKQPCYSKRTDFSFKHSYTVKLKLLWTLFVPYSFHNGILTSTLTPRDSISKPFLYMSQREACKFVIDEDPSTPHSSYGFDDTKLAFVFSMGRCGSTLISNLLRTCNIASVSECDALSSAHSAADIYNIVNRVAMAVHFGDSHIAFKLRASSCRDIERYIQLFPAAHFIFACRSPAGWAKSYSAKFGWPAQRLISTYKIACMAYTKLNNSTVAKLLMNYDQYSEWPKILATSDLVQSSCNTTSVVAALETELQKDSQTGYIDNSFSTYSDAEVNEFLSSCEKFSFNDFSTPT